MPFWAEVDGLDELERESANADRALSDGCRTAVANAVTEGAAEARSTHAYQDRSGDLTRSIDGRVEVSTPGGAVGVIVAKESYASFVDAGTGPHDIHAKAGRGFIGALPKGQSRGRGKGGGNLTFQIGDRWISVPMVHHPGTKADGFLGRAFQKAERVLLREVENAVAEVQKIIER